MLFVSDEKLYTRIKGFYVINFHSVGEQHHHSKTTLTSSEFDGYNGRVFISTFPK